MWAALESCGCGNGTRLDGRIDSEAWEAMRAPNLRGVVEGGMPGGPPSRSTSFTMGGLLQPSPPPTPPGPKTPPPKGPDDEPLDARTIAARVLKDAQHGRTENIRELLSGLDKTQSAALLSATDLAAGNNALMLASKNGHAACCRCLIEEFGADVHALNRHKCAAIDLATDKKVIKVLTDAGSVEFPAL